MASMEIQGNGDSHLDEGKGRGQESSARTSTMDSSFSMGKADAQEHPLSEAKVHCSFNINKVVEVFSTFTGEKEQIIQKIKFGGLMKLPKQIPMTQCLVNRQFCLWLMRNVDVDCSEINLGVRGRIQIRARDINRVLGLPWKGQTILSLKSQDKEKIHGIIRRQLLLSDSDKLDLQTIQQILVRDYPKCMTDEHRMCFAVAAVIYAVSYFLAPKGRPPRINNEILPYLEHYKSIRNVNWSDYVLNVLLESCAKVQHDVCLPQASVIHDGCLLVLQIMYLDNLEYGTSRTKQYILPRVIDFKYDALRMMIELDSNQNAVDNSSKYGKCELRHPFESNTRGDKYHAMKAKMQPLRPNTTNDDDMSTLVEFFTYYIEAEKRNLQDQAEKNVFKKCSTMDRCLSNLIGTSERWVAMRKRKREANLFNSQEVCAKDNSGGNNAGESASKNVVGMGSRNEHLIAEPKNNAATFTTAINVLCPGVEKGGAVEKNNIKLKRTRTKKKCCKPEMGNRIMMDSAEMEALSADGHEATPNKILLQQNKVALPGNS